MRLDQETREALERIRRADNGENVMTIYDCSHPPRYAGRWSKYDAESYGNSQLTADHENVSNAMLAVYPSDDDEPITNEWVSANWPAEMKRLGIYLCCCDGCNPGVIYITTGELHPCVVDLREVKNRGDVRAFLRGMGLETKGGE